MCRALFVLTGSARLSRCSESHRTGSTFLGIAERSSPIRVAVAPSIGVVGVESVPGLPGPSSDLGLAPLAPPPGALPLQPLEPAADRGRRSRPPPLAAAAERGRRRRGPRRPPARGRRGRRLPLAAGGPRRGAGPARRLRLEAARRALPQGPAPGERHAGAAEAL